MQKKSYIKNSNEFDIIIFIKILFKYKKIVIYYLIVAILFSLILINLKKKENFLFKIDVYPISLSQFNNTFNHVRLEWDDNKDDSFTLKQYSPLTILYAYKVILENKTEKNTNNDYNNFIKKTEINFDRFKEFNKFEIKITDSNTYEVKNFFELYLEESSMILRKEIYLDIENQKNIYNKLNNEKKNVNIINDQFNKTLTNLNSKDKLVNYNLDKIDKRRLDISKRAIIILTLVSLFFLSIIHILILYDFKKRNLKAIKF
jgi:hypothetical protein